MTNLEHTHPVLFVKLDGIGDYLFFRLFWPQIMEVAKKRKEEISLLCSDSFLPLVEKYDKKYVKNYFNLDAAKKWKKAKFLFFLPHYYKMFRLGWVGHLLWVKKWERAYNMQPIREVFVEKVMARVKSSQKVSNDPVNTLLAPKEFYDDSIYTRLLSIPRDRFIVSFFQKLLEESLQHPFEYPTLALPFSKQDIQATIRRKKLDKGYIVFVPFTSTPLRNWPLERFVFLAQKLAERTCLPIVVIGKYKKVSHKVWRDNPHVIDLVNRTSLIEAMQLAAGATYAVCSDTSLMHCALIGGAHTISLSNGRCRELFVNYPVDTGVKQKVFFPDPCNVQGIGRIEDIDQQLVWQYIQENWGLF